MMIQRSTIKVQPIIRNKNKKNQIISIKDKKRPPKLPIPMLKEVQLNQEKYDLYKYTDLNQDQIFEQELYIYGDQIQQTTHIALTISLRAIQDNKIIQKIVSQFYQFPNLKELNLSGNKIESIDNLQKMNMRSLKQLDLDQNQIVSIRSLRKMYLRDLDWIMVSNNNIIEFSGLQELYSPYLGALTLQKLYDSQKPQGQGDATKVMLKMQTNFLNMISIAALKRKKWGQYDSILRKKFLQIRIQRLNIKDNYFAI